MNWLQRMNKPLEVRCSGAGVVLYLLWFRSLSMVVAKSYIQWPWSSSQIWVGRDSTMAGFERGQIESSLRLRKACGRDGAVGSVMTSILPSWRSWSCSTRMETFG